MADMYAAALVSCDVDACDSCTRSLAGNATTSLAYRLRACSRRAAREIGDILIARYEERVFGSRQSSEYVQVGDGVFAPSAMGVPLVPPPLPPLCTPLASPGLQPPLASSFSTGERLHFASSTLSTSAQVASPSSFGRLSTLTPLVPAATASRSQSQSLSTTVALSGIAAAVIIQSGSSSRTTVGPSTVEAAVSVQPPAGSSVHPLSLPRAEYEAMMLQSPQSPPQMSPVEPASASTKATAPAPAAATV